MELLYSLKRLSISKWLSKNKGGVWKYDGYSSWWCDDEKRHLARVALDASDENSGAGYVLYGDEKPEWVHFY